MMERFDAIVREMSHLPALAVAYSGGVDSSTVAAAAHRAQGSRAVAVTAVSETLPKRELREAEAGAREIGIRHETVSFSELANSKFQANDTDRCYLCQTMRFRRLEYVARTWDAELVAAGTNQSDLGEFRPGLRAMGELGIYQPLLKHSVTKEEVRRMARALGLSVWDKPAKACLSSRIPHGRKITQARLDRIETAEEVLYQEEFRQVRVRDHGPLARIEVGGEEMERFLDPGRLERVREGVRAAGFDRVAVDLMGYQTGSVTFDPSSPHE